MMRSPVQTIAMASSLLLIVSLIGCGPKLVTKHDKFPLMYEESPAAILILPPINETTAADAKMYYSSTVQEPLSNCGYYVLPYEMTTDVMKQEGLYDTELIENTPLIKFKEFFGADAVLFTRISKWNMSYMVLAANLTVSIDCKLKSTTTNRDLWNYNGTVVVDLSGGNTGGGLPGLILKAVLTAARSAMADYVPYARQANYFAFAAMPKGKYDDRHGKDQADKVIDQTKQF